VKRIVVIVALISLLAGILAAGFVSVGFYLSPQDDLQPSDAVVAISGGDTNARAAEAIRLYKANWAPILIFSGAALDPTGPSNAQAMQQIAIDQGVPARSILLDEDSTNTAQNATGVAAIARSRNFHRIILVTSPYHQRRAGLVFRAAMGPDVQIINHSSYDQNWRRSRWWENDASVSITLAELQKTIYVLWAQRSGQP
jgi:uncharacterized SAM-binding protein YcdF (DUF218 family)